MHPSRMTAVLAVALAVAIALVATPAPASEREAVGLGRQDEFRQAQQNVTDRELGQYVQALRAIGRWQPRVAATLRQGDPMDRRLFDEATLREKMRGLREVEQAGLSADRFLDIAQRINREAPLRQRYSQLLRTQLVRASGG
jgi:hypothetical protein